MAPKTWGSVRRWKFERLAQLRSWRFAAVSRELRPEPESTPPALASLGAVRLQPQPRRLRLRPPAAAASTKKPPSEYLPAQYLRLRLWFRLLGRTGKKETVHPVSQTLLGVNPFVVLRRHSRLSEFTSRAQISLHSRHCFRWAATGSFRNGDSAIQTAGRRQSAHSLAAGE